MPVDDVQFGQLLESVDTIKRSLPKLIERVDALEQWRSAWGGISFACMILGGLSTVGLLVVEIYKLPR